MDNQIEIPEEIQEICRQFAKVARDNGLRDLHCSFNPGFDSKWRPKIEMSWEQGRHGSDKNMLYIASTHHVHANIEDKGGKQ